MSGISPIRKSSELQQAILRRLALRLFGNEYAIFRQLKCWLGNSGSRNRGTVAMTEGPREKMLKRLRAYRDRKLFEAVGAALYEAADAVRAEASRSITAGSVSGKGHVPSIPGTPPNNDSSNLRLNIRVSQSRPDRSRVTSHASYSAVHEFGSSTHPARPFLRPARDKVKPEAERILEKRINRAVKVY